MVTRCRSLTRDEDRSSRSLVHYPANQCPDQLVQCDPADIEGSLATRQPEERRTAISRPGESGERRSRPDDKADIEARSIALFPEASGPAGSKDDVPNRRSRRQRARRRQA